MNIKLLVAPVLILGMLATLAVGFFSMQPQTPPANTTPEAPKEAVASGSGFETLYLLPEGSIAPAINTTDAEGKPFKSADVLEQGKGIVAIFYQGVFCSVCANQLEGFQKMQADFNKKGYEIVAISADDIKHAEERKAKSGLDFTVLHDEARKIISDFGVANTTRANIAYPTVYVINKENRVAYTFADASMQRLQASELLPKL
jgi:glutaredoxin-dependent peroxiredoxin